MKKIWYFHVFLIFLACTNEPHGAVVYESDQLKISQLSNHIFLHTSYLEIPSYGPFPCNGIFVKSGSEALVLDTPTSDPTSAELINWIKKELGCKVTGVVVNHFHVDCLGGLKYFHEQGIPSFSSERTIELAKRDSLEVPLNGFSKSLELLVGDISVVNEYLGEGHSRDNIVSYIPKEKTLFGGCMVKEKGAGKGNLKDAKVEEWPLTIQNTKDRFSDVQLVIPGHGKPGGMELLDYTIELFSEYKQQ